MNYAAQQRIEIPRHNENQAEEEKKKKRRNTSSPGRASPTGEEGRTQTDEFRGRNTRTFSLVKSGDHGQ